MRVLINKNAFAGMYGFLNGTIGLVLLPISPDGLYCLGSARADVQWVHHSLCTFLDNRGF